MTHRTILGARRRFFQGCVAIERFLQRTIQRVRVYAILQGKTSSQNVERRESPRCQRGANGAAYRMALRSAPRCATPIGLHRRSSFYLGEPRKSSPFLAFCILCAYLPCFISLPIPLIRRMLLVPCVPTSMYIVFILTIPHSPPTSFRVYKILHCPMFVICFCFFF